MNEKNTIERIEESLLKLLESQTLYEVKAREVCHLANVHHQTFYNHYCDLFDLYEKLEHKAIEEALSILSAGFAENSIHEQNQYIALILKTKYFFRMMNQKDNTRFKENVSVSIYPVLEEKIRVMTRERERNYLTQYILTGSISIIEAWIRQGCKENPEYIGSLLYQIAGSIDLYH